MPHKFWKDQTDLEKFQTLIKELIGDEPTKFAVHMCLELWPEEFETQMNKGLSAAEAAYVILRTRWT